MAKGSASKTQIFNKILEIFPNSFMYNDGKELRINMTEEGELVQIKLTATCAKTPVSADAGFEVPGGVEPTIPADIPFDVTKPESFEPTETEKDNLQKLMNKLGL